MANQVDISSSGVANSYRELVYPGTERARDTAIRSQQSITTMPYQHVSNCSSGSTKHYDMSMHIIAIFVIFTASALGVLLPILTNQSSKFKGLQRIFFVLRFFGCGVITTTGMVHIFPEAIEALSDPCLPEWFTSYPSAGLFSLFGCFCLHLIAWTGMRSIRQKTSEKNIQGDETDTLNSYKQKQHNLTTFTLECGIMVHSIIIGVSLGLPTDEFVSLFIALCFHQFFEGIGLGSLLIGVDFRAWWSSVFTGLIYAMTTPTGVAIGIGIRKGTQNPIASQIAVGIFESFAAGMLIYSGLVCLLHQGFSSDEFFELPWWEKAACFISLYAGAGSMATIAAWA